VIAPEGQPAANIDARVQALEAAIRNAVAKGDFDASRIYLGGRGPSSSAVFYAISRLPDLWAAALAVGGSPQPAIDSNRIFAVNFSHTPVLWAGSRPEDQELAAQLKAAGLNLEYRTGEGLPIATALQWLSAHRRDEFPLTADCETNSPSFASCYWIQGVKLDAGERNDVLPPTLIPGGAGATLELGPFGYKLDDPGPGVLVTSLPEKYKGPLKTGDRILSLGGVAISDARQFRSMMAAAEESKSTAVMVQRGDSRTRVETRIVVPRREPVVTARMQAVYIPQEKEIRIITRGVAQLRVTIPPHWVPVTASWNGLPMEEVKAPGCLALRVEKELLRAEKCN
jgi:hypothetical protein